MATFPSSPAPSQASAAETRSFVNFVQFGDGYSQRIPETINNIVEAYNLSWKAITTTDRDTLTTFLRARNAVEAFEWTPPGEGTAKKFICRQWRWTYGEYNLVDFSATFEQVFES